MNKENENETEKEKFFNDSPKKNKNEETIMKWVYPLILLFFILLLLFVVMLAKRNSNAEFSFIQGLSLSPYLVILPTNKEDYREDLREQQSYLEQSLELLEQQERELNEWLEQQKKDQFYISQFPEVRDREAIQRLSLEYDLSPEFLYRWIYLESHVNPLAVGYELNGTYSYGYLQLNSMYNILSLKQ